MIAVEEEEKNLDQAQLDLEIIGKRWVDGSKKGQSSVERRLRVCDKLKSSRLDSKFSIDTRTKKNLGKKS